MYRGTSLVRTRVLTQDHRKATDRPTVGPEGVAAPYGRGTSNIGPLLSHWHAFRQQRHLRPDRAHSSSVLDTLAKYSRHTLVCWTRSPVVPSILVKCAEHTSTLCYTPSRVLDALAESTEHTRVCWANTSMCWTHLHSVLDILAECAGHTQVCWT